LIPWMLEAYKEDASGASWPLWLVTFLQKIHGPHWAFGTPGILMFIATVIFWLGRKKFVHLPPVGLKNYIAEIRQPENFKAIANILILVPFASMFWALWQQNFSSWVVQAEKMDRNLFGHEWLAAQIQTVNPIFILTMLPLFSYAIYPAIERVFRLTSLRKFGMGLFVTALAFLIVALIQLRIDAGQRPNVIWQILAFLVLTAGEILVSVTHLEFAYTQAPKKLKSLVMCTYLLGISLGNLFTAIVDFFTKALHLQGETQGSLSARYFFFFVIVMLITATLFLFFARFYKGKTYIQDEAQPEPA
jgi:POT family proton-dependent oligopeptide transporter